MNIADVNERNYDIPVAVMEVTSAKTVDPGMIQEGSLNEERARDKTDEPRSASLHSAKNQGKTQRKTKEDVESLEHVVRGIDELVKKMARRLSFSIHDKTGEVKVQVINDETGDVIREIPPNELLNIAARLQETVGILFDKEV